MRRPGIGEVERAPGCRRDRVEQRLAHHSMIAVVHVPVAEEHRGGVVAQHDLWAPVSYQPNKPFTQCRHVLDLTVSVPKSLVVRNPERGAGRTDLVRTRLDEALRIRAGVVTALVTPRAHDKCHGASLGCPA